MRVTRIKGIILELFSGQILSQKKKMDTKVEFLVVCLTLVSLVKIGYVYRLYKSSTEEIRCVFDDI